MSTYAEKQPKDNLEQLTARNLQTLTETIIDNDYIPHIPFQQQAEFLLTPEREVMYGGAAGGGKSDAILMGALQHVDKPQYKSLILRRTYPELTQEEGLVERAEEWLTPTDAKWSASKKRWYFPSGATLSFGHMEYDKDKYKFHGSAYHFIAFDELTQFTEIQYRFLFRSLRKGEQDPLPLRMRSTSNPGGVGHEFVKQRFIRGDKRFIPSTWKDNPHLDQEEYEQSLNKLDYLTRQQLKHGNWDINPQGQLFKRSWFTTITNPIQKIEKQVRFWDLAATISKKGRDPDYTVGLLLGIDKDHNMTILDIQRLRETPHQIETTILQTATTDGTHTPIRMEQEGGASGKIVIEDYTTKLIGYNFKGSRPTTSKEDRAKPVSSYAESGRLYILDRTWTAAFLDEVEAFKTEGIHDDQVDALSGAFAALAFGKRASPQLVGVEL